MSAVILDGRETRQEIFADLKQRVSTLKSQGINPGLATILVGNDPASEIYVKGKHADCAEIGINSIKVNLPAGTTEVELLSKMAELNNNPACSGYIVQLPLPKPLSDIKILDAIPADKDADGLSSVNLGRLVIGFPGVLPCTANGILYLLNRYGIKLSGKKVVIVGAGLTAGRPLGLLFSGKNINATVTTCNKYTENLAEITRQADIVVAAAGVPNLITAEMVKPNSVILDVGVTRVDNKIVGDVAAEVKEVAAYISPNPGGVGLLTRAFLMVNIVEAAEKQWVSKQR